MTDPRAEHLLILVDQAYAAGVAAGRRQAAEAIRERAEAARTVDLTGPRAVRYRTLRAAARIADNPLAVEEAAEALNDAVVCHLDEAGRPIEVEEATPDV